MTPEDQFLVDMAVVLVVAGICSLLFSRLKFPAVIGYLVAGIIVGPHAPPFSLVTNIESVNIMASLGVILLMFSIGLDFNLRRLRKVGLFAIIAGSVEILLMMTIGYTLGNWLGWSNTESIFLGAVMSISSTAVIIKVLSDMGKLKKEFTEAIIGILIIEDFAAVIILTLAAPITGGSGLDLGSLFGILIGIVFFVAISIILGIAIIPKAVNWISSKFSGETLLLVSLGLCFAMAAISLVLGLSVAIGAFIMGVIISQSNSVEAVDAKIIPVKEMFLAIFFVSIGMMIDPSLVFQNFWAAVIIAAVFVVGKTLSVGFAGYVSNLGARTSFMAGMGMVAMGEFSFVIAKVGADSGAVGSFFYSTVIGAALITILVLPISVKNSERMVDWISSRIPGPVRSTLALIERLRASVRERLAASAERRKEVRRNIVWIFIDFTFIFVIAVAANVVYGLTDLVANLAQISPILPALLIGGLSVAAMLPAVVSIVKRLRNIVAVLVKVTLETGRFNALGGRVIYRIFMGMFTLFVVIVLLFLMVSLIPTAREITFLPPLVIVIVGGLIAYVLWDLTRSAHERMSEMLSKGLVDEGEKGKGDENR